VLVVILSSICKMNLRRGTTVNRRNDLISMSVARAKGCYPPDLNSSLACVKRLTASDAALLQNIMLYGPSIQCVLPGRDEPLPCQ
jgi:hypothetical protein